MESTYESAPCPVCGKTTPIPVVGVEQAMRIFDEHRNCRPKPPLDELSEEQALAVAEALMVDVRTKDPSYDRTLTVLEVIKGERR